MGLFSTSTCGRLVSELLAKFGFSPFSRLYGLLDGFLSQIWSYFEMSLALDPTPFALGSATSLGHGWKLLIFDDPSPKLLATRTAVPALASSMLRVAEGLVLKPQLSFF